MAAALFALTYFSLGVDASPSLVAWYKCDGSGADAASVPDAQGHSPMQLDLSGAAKVSLSSSSSGDSAAIGAIMLFGNASSGYPLRVPHHREIETEEFTIALWLNYWWDASGSVLFRRGSALSYFMLYRGSPKVEVHTATGGKTEWTAYPQACSAVFPGAWNHLAFTYSKKGDVSLYVNGAFCASGKGDSGGAKSDSAGLEFPQWAGLLSDFRVYSAPLAASDVAAVWNETRASYAPGTVAHALPPRGVVVAAGRAWTPPPLAPSAADTPLHDAWLNFNLSGPGTAVTAARLPAFVRRVVWSADPDPAVHEAAGTPLLSRPHPARRTAVRELAAALQAMHSEAAGRKGSGVAVLSDAAILKDSELGDAVVIGTCEDRAVRRVLRAASPRSSCGSSSAACPRSCPLSPTASEEAFAVRLLGLPDGGGGRVLLVVGGGAPGMLYGAFGIARRVQLGGSGGGSGDDNGRAWWDDRASLAWEESPSTRYRIINHWNQWRGFAMDAFYPPALAGRGDSMFNWTAMALNTTAATRQVRDWARLLASVGVNALAPQDVNYDQRCAYLQHLDELPALAAVLREYAIALFWTPNYLLAPLQSTADALYAAVPDFGGCKMMTRAMCLAV